MVMEQPDLVEACFDLIRMPARIVWIEWSENFEAGRGRIGLIVRTDEDGRRGNIQTVWENSKGRPIPEIGRIAFDFDGAVSAPPDSMMRHTDPKVSDLLAHFWLEPSPGVNGKEFLKARNKIADCIWLTGPLIAAFCILITFRNDLQSMERSFDRLNMKRAKLGKPALLNHIEIKTSLLHSTSNGDSGSSGSSGLSRRECRLHHVRGHFVRRGATVYWRGAHLRGSAQRGIAPKRTQIVGL
jgi:hypothetical protein